jgi:hypothetical protein
VLCRDLGVKEKRRSGLREWVVGYGPQDYEGLVGEWVGKVSEGGGEGKKRI